MPDQLFELVNRQRRTDTGFIEKQKFTNFDRSSETIPNPKTQAAFVDQSTSSTSVTECSKLKNIPMEKPEGYPHVDDDPRETEPSISGKSFLGAKKNDLSLLESGLLRRNYSDVGKSYYTFQSPQGAGINNKKSVDPRMLALVEFFRELYFRNLEMFKIIFPGHHNEVLDEMPKKLSLVLSQVKSDQKTARVRTMQRSLSIGSPREFKKEDSTDLRLERFKVRTIDVDDDSIEQGDVKTKPAAGSK